LVQRARQQWGTRHRALWLPPLLVVVVLLLLVVLVLVLLQAVVVEAEGAKGTAVATVRACMSGAK